MANKRRLVSDFRVVDGSEGSHGTPAPNREPMRVTHATMTAREAKAKAGLVAKAKVSDATRARRKAAVERRVIDRTAKLRRDGEHLVESKRVREAEVAKFFADEQERLRSQMAETYGRSLFDELMSVDWSKSERDKRWEKMSAWNRASWRRVGQMALSWVEQERAKHT